MFGNGYERGRKRIRLINEDVERIQRMDKLVEKGLPLTATARDRDTVEGYKLLRSSLRPGSIEPVNREEMDSVLRKCSTARGEGEKR
jgi:hypothetical protein